MGASIESSHANMNQRLIDNPTKRPLEQEARKQSIKQVEINSQTEAPGDDYETIPTCNLATLGRFTAMDSNSQHIVASSHRCPKTSESKLAPLKNRCANNESTATSAELNRAERYIVSCCRPKSSLSGKRAQAQGGGASILDRIARKPISQSLFITVILIVFLDAAKRQLILIADGQLQDWSAGRVTSFRPERYSFASARLVYSPETMRTINRRETKLNSSSSSVDSDEARYRYKLESSLASAPTKPQNNARLDSIQAQLADLRRQLDTEFATVEARRQVALGSPCLRASDCSNSIKGAHCKLDSFTCACLPYYVRFNSTTCLPPSLLGYECLIDAQCQKKVPDSYCSSSSGVCVCKEHLVTFRKDKCLAASKLDDYCLTDKQCQLADRHSHCKWRIPHVYGLCKCPPNYKPITTSLEQTWPALAGNKSIVDEQKEEERLRDSQLNNTANVQRQVVARIRCAPRLGDTCLDLEDCLLATPNSVCRSPEPNDTLKPNWASSSVSPNKCFCAPGFSPAPNRLECVAAGEPRPPGELPGGPSAAQLASSAQMDNKHQYEIVADAANSAQPAIFAQPPKTTTTSLSSIADYNDADQNRPEGGRVDLSANKSINININTNTKSEKPNVTISSLGKPCKTRLDCQARDKYSDCISGRCDCIKATTRCSANFTGCHRDTFQCRNGQCISWYFVCDQFRNCDDGSDEDECQSGSCPPEAFQCDNGTCLARGKVCNGLLECVDGSDERHCNISGATFTWRPPSLDSGVGESGQVKVGQFSGLAVLDAAGEQQQQQRRHHYQQQQQQRQDHLVANTSYPARRCHPSAFQCDNGQCLPAYVFCNAVEDCQDASDEREQLCERQLPAPGALLAPARRKWPQLEAGEQQVAVSGESTKQHPPAGTSKDSPLVKADRSAIEKMLAALNLASRTPESRGRLPPTQMEARLSRRFKRSHLEPARVPEVSVGRTGAGNKKKKAKTVGHMRRESKLTRQRQTNSDDLYASTNAISAAANQANLECPKWSFTCTNGKCRSSAILCSGVDGCGDSSDEQACEVCKCEAP